MPLGLPQWVTHVGSNPLVSGYPPKLSVNANTPTGLS